MSQRSRVRGFGLLEAIVAMALLGTAGLMLFAWIQDSLQTAQRLRDAEARARLQIEMQGYVAKLNPMRKPRGEERLAEVALSWKSRLIEPEQGEFNYGEMVTPLWRIGLYEVEVEARQETHARWTQVVSGWLPNTARGGS